MKHNLLIIITLLSINTYGQAQFPLEDGKVLYRQVIELDTSYKAKGLFSATKTWFSTNPKNFWRSNSEKQSTSLLLGTDDKDMAAVNLSYKNETPLKLADADEKHCIGHSIIRYTGGKLGCIRIVFVEYDIDVITKDGKAKIEASNFNYTHFNQATGKQFQIYGLSDKGNCKSKGPLEDLLTCDHCEKEQSKFYAYVDENVKAQLADFEVSIKKKQQKDW